MLVIRDFIVAYMSTDKVPDYWNKHWIVLKQINVNSRYYVYIDTIGIGNVKQTADQTAVESYNLCTYVHYMLGERVL